MIFDYEAYLSVTGLVSTEHESWYQQRNHSSPIVIHFPQICYQRPNQHELKTHAHWEEEDVDVEVMVKVDDVDVLVSTVAFNTGLITMATHSSNSSVHTH